MARKHTQPIQETKSSDSTDVTPPIPIEGVTHTLVDVAGGSNRPDVEEDKRNGSPITLNDATAAKQMVDDVLPPDPDVVAHEKASVEGTQSSPAPAASPVAGTPIAERTPDGRYEYPPRAEWHKYQLDPISNKPIRRKDNKGWRLKRGPVQDEPEASQQQQQTQDQNAKPKITINPIQLAKMGVVMYVSAHQRAFDPKIEVTSDERAELETALAIWLESEGINPPPWLALLFVFGFWSFTHIITSPAAMLRIQGAMVKLGLKRPDEPSGDLTQPQPNTPPQV